MYSYSRNGSNKLFICCIIVNISLNFLIEFQKMKEKFIEFWWFSTSDIGVYQSVIGIRQHLSEMKILNITTSYFLFCLKYPNYYFILIGMKGEFWKLKEKNHDNNTLRRVVLDFCFSFRLHIFFSHLHLGKKGVKKEI